MSAHPAPAAPDLAVQQAADAQYYRQVLHKLIDMGTDLASQLHQHATAQATVARNAEAPPAADEPAAPDVTLAFDRVARTVRRTILLAQKIAEPTKPRAADQGQHRAAARTRIIREVEDEIHRSLDDAGHADAEALHAELLDRLDSPGLDGDIQNRPVADIITDIRRDLGIAAMPGVRIWKRRTPADIEALRARAAAPAGAPRAAAGPPPLNSAVPRAAPRPIRHTLPDDPAEAIAMVLRYATPVRK